MKKIIFFNNFHNGDLFICKSFVKFIMNNFPAEYFYIHGRHPSILQDIKLNVISGNINLPDKLLEINDEIYINSWIGNYLGHFYYSGCNLKLLYEMFSDLVGKLNVIYNSDVKLNPNPEEYFPYIEYKDYNINGIDKFLLENSQEKILFSNGPALSDQNFNNSNLQEIITESAKANPEKIFIVTEKFYATESNIIFTEDMTGCFPDVNEIGYLSKFCSKIIGRSSGPFTFCMHKDNLNDETKNILCFGNNPVNVIPFEMKVKCNHKYVIDDNENNLKKEILEFIL